MQDPTIYDNQSALLRLLLQGKPGSGKSCVAGQFPGAYILDLDRNFKSAYDYLRSINKHTNIVGIDFADEDDKKVKIPLPQQFNRLNSLLDLAESNDKIQTIVLDSGTIFVRILQAHVLGITGGTDATGRPFWQKFGDHAAHFIINKLMNSRKHIVMTIHETLKTDEKGFPVYPHKVTFPGGTGERIGMFFTNVWRCEPKLVWDGKKNIRKWNINADNCDTKFELKNTLVGLPSEFEFDWNLVEKHLKPNNTQTTQTK